MHPLHKPETLDQAQARLAQALKERNFRIADMPRAPMHRRMRVWITNEKAKPLDHGATRRLQRQMLQVFRDLGWWTGHSKAAIYMRHRRGWLRRVAKHENFSAARGNLRVRASFAPRYSEIRFYPDHNTAHGSGPYYANTVEAAAVMRPREWRLLWQALLALRSELTWLGWRDASPPYLEDGLERVQHEYNECWHKKGQSIWDVRRNAFEMRCNYVDAEGQILENGQWRAVYGGWGEGGGIRIGQVFHNLNSMWWVVDPEGVRNIPAARLYPIRPGMARRWFPDKGRYRKLRRLEELAASERAYEIAARFRDAAKGLEEALAHGA